jgi:ABC-2 type transport system permease protein
MRALAVFLRILRGFKRDKRTLALMMVAPVLLLSLLWVIFHSDEYHPKVAVVNLPDPLVAELEKQGGRIRQLDQVRADRLLRDGEVDAIIFIEKQRMVVRMEGSDPTASLAVQQLFVGIVKDKVAQLQPLADKVRPKLPPEVRWMTQAPKWEQLHGGREMSEFDSFGPVLLGFIVFFFTFIVSGVSFVRERTTGTLERVLASPIRSWELVTGYALGFTVMVLAQVAIMSLYSVYVLGMMLVGSMAWLIAITLMLAISALTMGMFLSAYARNEFQLFQFIPLVIVPQVFFSGLFQLETMPGWLQAIGKVLPLTYGARAMREVMIRGGGLSSIWVELAVLTGCALAFMTLNVLILKNNRAV